MKRILTVLMFMGIIGLLVFTSCKTTEESSAQFTLTVTTTDGVSGTPAAGTYTYAENDLVSYSYTAGSGYKGLTVTLDGAPVAPNGTVTMTGNHTLAATAESYDVRGNWTGAAWQASGDSLFKCRFSGGKLSGATRGQILQLSGNWVDGEFTVTNGNEIEFNLNYFSNTAQFVFNGTITNDNHMNGTWDWYQNDKHVMSGGWQLERD